MEFVLYLNFFDGFEGYFTDNIFLECESLEKALEGAKRFERHIMARNDRPYLEDEIKVVTIDQWKEKHSIDEKGLKIMFPTPEEIEEENQKKLKEMPPTMEPMIVSLDEIVNYETLFSEDIKV